MGGGTFIPNFVYKQTENIYLGRGAMGILDRK